MKSFMDKDFLLSTETAKKLFHDYAEKMPIIDYHCHVSPREIAEDRTFENITQVWLGGDHYKWRLIRSNGVDEKYITGTESTDREKFQKFAEVMPKLIGNPMYHWTHLELQRYFGCNKPLSPETADEIWELCNKKLQDGSMSVRKIIEQSNVKVICTTDDPADDLVWHKKIAEDKSCNFSVVPAMRPDKVLRIEKPDFAVYINTLSKASGITIDSMKTLFEALESRISFFHEMGCRASDHALEYVFYREDKDNEADEIFKRARAGKVLSTGEIEIYKTQMLMFLAAQYAKRGWAMQIHYSCLRDGNSKEFAKQGPDTGFDTIAVYNSAEGIVKLLDAMHSRNQLPKMILYSLNPNDNELIDTILGLFQGPEMKGKIQHGAAWWFNDTKSGMEAHITSLANLSVLGNFVGMLTDSRSFLSYTRHEYFRRILCNWIGERVENGEYPADMETLGKMVQDISYNNTKNYFGFSE